MRVQHVRKSLRLTRKQNETRLQGLRILARMIVWAHLVSIREADVGRNGSGPAAPDGDPASSTEQALPPKEGGHVR